MKFLVVLVAILSLAFAENIDLDLNVEKREWVDLFDPLSSADYGSVHDPSTQQCANYDVIQRYQEQIDKLVTANEALKNRKTDSVDVLLKHILRKFFWQLELKLEHGHAVNKYARIRLSPSEVSVVLEYLNSQRHSEEVALREKLRFALENFIVAEEESDESGLLLMIRQISPYLLILDVIFLPILIFKTLHENMGTRKFLIFLLFSVFSMSYSFTYMRKYQEVLASRFARVQNSDDACSAKGLISEAFNVILGYVRIKGKDPCLQKYEDLLVEPLWLVDPLQVFGEVLTTFLMSPFSVIGIHLNKFFNDFFIDTPLPLAIVKLIFIILIMFYLFGYRVRTIFATIEPARVIQPELPKIKEVPLPQIEEAPVPKVEEPACSDCK